jgi:hypothetical protein
MKRRALMKLITKQLQKTDNFLNMKKVTIAIAVLLMTGAVVQAQDLKKVRTAYNFTLLPNSGAAKLEDAKTEIDKVIADPKLNNTAEAWLFKAMIYGKLAGDEALSAKYAAANTQALAALRKYLELDPEAKKIREENFGGLNETYRSFFSLGVKEYKANNWVKAHDYFRQLVDLSDLMVAKKWTTTAFDTTAYLYAGVTAQNAKMEDDAVKYYSTLADRKIAGPDYEGVYDYVSRYYMKKKNQEKFNQYITLSREAYPKLTVWNDLQFNYLTTNYELPELVKYFDEQDAAKKLTSMEYFDYGNFFVNDKKVKDLEEAKRGDYTRKSAYAFAKSYELDTTNLLAAYNTGVTYFALYEAQADAARQIKGVTPEIKAKRSQADKFADASADKAIEWLERAYTSLAAKKERSNLERGSLNKSIDLLYNAYNYKRDRSRGVNPKDYDKYDAKMKLYDSLHGKY